MSLVLPGRCRFLRNTSNGLPRQGSVLYWMSRDQRLQDNWALLKAMEVARDASLPMAVVFCMTRGFPGATFRAYDFMLHGLSELEASCASLKIPFFLLDGEPPAILPKFADVVQCSVLITDFSPMPVKKLWLTTMLTTTPLQPRIEQIIEVDAHNVVPVWVASDKREHAARTIRPKITQHLKTYLTDFPAVTPQLVTECLKTKWPSTFPQPTVGEAVPAFRKVLNVDNTVRPVSWITPGEAAALAASKAFACSTARLAEYGSKRNDPVANAQSGLSPYFHFGNVAPQRVAWMCTQHKRSISNAAAEAGADGFLEELIIRRELSDNYVYHTGTPPDWPGWAVETLKQHEKDAREHLYTREELETSKTYDDLWNAAQKELVALGKLHGFMRMYWAKKILEWSPNAQTAYDVALYLNDKYSLDGRDPNGNVGVAWSIYGVHDMGWTERSIFGKIRFMNYNGCKRKFDIPAYIARVNAEAARESGTTLAAGAPLDVKPTLKKGSTVLDKLQAAPAAKRSPPPDAVQQDKRPQPRREGKR